MWWMALKLLLKKKWIWGGLALVAAIAWGMWYRHVLIEHGRHLEQMSHKKEIKQLDERYAARVSDLEKQLELTRTLKPLPPPKVLIRERIKYVEGKPVSCPEPSPAFRLHWNEFSGPTGEETSAVVPTAPTAPALSAPRGF